jgi:spore coat protein CotH
VVYPKDSGLKSTSMMHAFVRIHGATSQGLPKKSYSFSLEEPWPLAGLRTNAHWILNAAYIDRSLMRHKLSYDLFRSLSTKEHPRFAVASRFVEVYLNGEYNGAYLLMERADRQLFELRSYHTNDFRHACIYKAVDHAANFARRDHAGYEQREPDPATLPYWQPLELFNQFVSTAPDTNFFALPKGIAARLDLDNAVDFHLLVLLTCNSDGITKNFFLARNGQETGPTVNQRFFFAPWDYDGTFGRNWDARPYPLKAWLSNHLFERLLEDEAYHKKFAARWRQLRQHEFAAKTIQEMMDANARTLGEAAQRNAQRWPTTRGRYPDQLTFEQDVAQMKTWIEARLDWLDQTIKRFE